MVTICCKQWLRCGTICTDMMSFRTTVKSLSLHILWRTTFHWVTISKLNRLCIAMFN